MQYTVIIQKQIQDNILIIYMAKSRKSLTRRTKRKNRRTRRGGVGISSIAALEQCSICVEDMDSNIVTTQCGHKFHRWCLIEWQNSGQPQSNTCPICRQPLVEQNNNSNTNSNNRNRTYRRTPTPRRRD